MVEEEEEEEEDEEEEGENGEERGESGRGGGEVDESMVGDEEDRVHLSMTRAARER